jgi:aspartate aminotransferase
MTRIAERLFTIEESQTIGMAKKTRELQAKGVAVIPLHFGEPDFDTPQYIKDAAKAAIDQGKTKYTPVPGVLEFREAIAQKFRNENGLDYNAENIVVSTGAKHAIMNVIMCTINPGDEVMVPTPYWVSYSEMIKFAGGIPVYINASIHNNFTPNWEEVKAAISPKTKMFLFSSPNNPTGNVFSYADLSHLAEILGPHKNIIVVSDEIYEHIRFGKEKHTSIGTFEQLKDRVVTVNGVSKAFAMTGWRIGYIGAPLDIAKACEKLQSQFTSGANSIAQYASMAAITGDLAPTKAMTKAFEERKNFVTQRLSKIEGIICNQPEGAFYVFPDISSFFGKSFGKLKIENAYDLCIYLLENAHVSLVSGGAFGNGNCVRISYATNLENLALACDKIELALKQLN